MSNPKMMIDNLQVHLQENVEWCYITQWPFQICGQNPIVIIYSPSCRSNEIHFNACHTMKVYGVQCCFWNIIFCVHTGLDQHEGE